MKSDLFTVNGEGETTAVPDTAVVTLGISETANSIEQVKNKVNTKINDIISGLKKLEIEEKKIKTTNYSIYPNYDYTNGTNRITGYSISQTLQVEITPIEKANKALDLSTEKGANMVGNIEFKVNDKDREKLEIKARENAIKKAKEKAQNIASAAGIRLGRIVNVYESGTEQPPVIYAKESLARGGDTANQSTELQPGENTIHISVTLSYETL
jgi:uncharacterized protein YggE